MAERPIAPVLKTGGASLLGSNPSPTAFSTDRADSPETDTHHR
jgi:hypothetical protein